LCQNGTQYGVSHQTARSAQRRRTAGTRRRTDVGSGELELGAVREVGANAFDVIDHAARILDRLDYDVIRRNPKILSGYSDITSLHFAFARNVNLISIHAPMFNGALDGPKVPEFTKKSFFRTIMEAKPAGSICDGYDKKNVLTLRSGVAEGRLIGGNLSLICASLGTPFAPSFKGKILFFEDISEKPYRLDRMLTQLLNAGILRQVAGVAVGVNQDCADPDAKVVKEYLQTAADVLQEVSMVLWRRFETFELGTNFFAWACKIARFQVMKYRERQGRSARLFDNSLLEKLAADAADENVVCQVPLQALENCLGKLSEVDRSLIRRRYQPGMTVQQIAADHGRSANALSKSLGRIRRALLECIDRTLALEARQ